MFSAVQSHSLSLPPLLAGSFSEVPNLQFYFPHLVLSHFFSCGYFIFCVRVYYANTSKFTYSLASKILSALVMSPAPIIVKLIQNRPKNMV